MKKTLILGASTNPERYAFKAANRLLDHGHPIVMIGKRSGEIRENSIEKEKAEFTDIDTVTLYLNPQNQKEYYDYILNLNPKRIIFNPGTENPELEAMAQNQGIETTEACTLVLLSIGEF